MQNAKVTSPADFWRQECQSSLLLGTEIFTLEPEVTIESTFSDAGTCSDEALTIPELLW